MPELDYRPGLPDLEFARNYFDELHSAANLGINFSTGAYYYWEPIEEGYKGRGVKDGFLRRKRTIPLEQMEKQVTRLQYAARQLDKLPAYFWTNYNKTYNPELPVIPMQILNWGTANIKGPLSQEKQALLWEDYVEERGQFSVEARFYERQFDNLDRKTKGSEVEDRFEQCYRILESYIQLRWYFGSKGLPSGVKEF